MSFTLLLILVWSKVYLRVAQPVVMVSLEDSESLEETACFLRRSKTLEEIFKITLLSFVDTTQAQQLFLVTPLAV
jgi:hypothetical protein